MKYVVLFLTDLLDPKAPDFEYTKEYQAAKKIFSSWLDRSTEII